MRGCVTIRRRQTNERTSKKRIMKFIDMHLILRVSHCEHIDVVSSRTKLCAMRGIRSVRASVLECTWSTHSNPLPAGGGASRSGQHQRLRTPWAFSTGPRPIHKASAQKSTWCDRRLLRQNFRHAQWHSMAPSSFQLDLQHRHGPRALRVAVGHRDCRF